MTNLKVKFYKQVVEASDNTPLNYIAIYENERKLHNGNIEYWLEGFNVIDGHFELKDASFLDSKCVEINKDSYLNGTLGFKSPSYLLQTDDDKFNCNMCDSKMNHKSLNNTHIYVCEECPNIQFEYYTEENLKDLISLLQ